MSDTVSQVRVHGPGDVRVDQIAPLVPGTRDALIRVAACGVCGTDLSYIRMGGLGGPGRDPLCLGHEMAGVVEWVGRDVTQIRTGERVIVQPGSEDLGRIGGGGPEGGLTPLLRVREADAGLLHRVPGHVPLGVAAFAEPLAVGMRAADQADVQHGEAVAVFGCGPIGLAAIATLIDRGHRQVVGIDTSPTRLALAAGLGAQATLNPTHDDVWAGLARLHGTAPFLFGPTPATAAVIEATGSAAVVEDIVNHVRVGGRLVVVAVHYQPISTSFLHLMMKELTIRGSMEYPPRFADAIDLLARRDLSGLITHRFALDHFTDALDVLGTSKDCGKVMIDCTPELIDQ